MNFDETYDQEKSQWTKENRGIDFIEARDIWKDPQAVEGPGTVVNSEERWLKVGTFKGKVWTAVFTYRFGAIRILSVRPARKDEKEAYYG